MKFFRGPTGIRLGPLLFNILITDLYDVIKHKCLLFVDDVKTFPAINSVEYFFLLQSDIAGKQCLCAASCMKLNSAKLSLMSLLEEQMVFIVLVKYGTFV